MGHFDKTPPPQVDDLAKKVTEQVSNGHLDGAYAMLKKELQTEFSTMPLEEKRETWNALSKKLEDNGTLPKLAAAWLSDWSTNNVTPPGASFSKGTFESVSKVLDPFTAGMAGEVSKQFDVASRLGADDGKIDASEIAAFKARQTQATPEKFADDLVKTVEKDLAGPAMTRAAYEKNPELSPNAKAYSDLSAQVFARRKNETPEEEAATWKIVDDKLKAKGLIPQLSMGWLDKVFTNKPVSESLLQANMKSINPIGQEMSGYLVSQFSKIGTVDYNLTEMSLNEREIYTSKLEKK